MPQPAELDTLQEPLLDKYRTAWTRVLVEQQKLANDPLAFRRRTRLTQMRRTIEGIMKGLDADAGDWIAKQLPRAYLAGASAASSGTGEAAFTQVHQEAVQRLSKGLFDELLGATQHVKDTTKQLIRTVAQDEALQKAIEGRTADQAAREMRRIIENKGIHAVRYADGSKHGLAEYTQVAMRTTTAKAYNSGTLGSALDVKFWEIFDGPNCGLSFHDDPTLALGMVVDRDTAERFLISHPNCRRSFGPRPDVTTANMAEKANPTSTKEQRQAQLEQDAVAPTTRPDVFAKREARLAAQKARYAESDRAARLAKRAATVRPPDVFPQFKRLVAPERYQEAYLRVNPGTGTAYRTNCHFVAPSMEMRARGYDVVASQTLKDVGRFNFSIAQDWVDPATGESRKFAKVGFFTRDTATGPARAISTTEELHAKLVAMTKDWPPGARGFITNEWKVGNGHIWNVYKDEQGELRYIDGQVKKANAKENLGRSKSLQIMRVDDLEPRPERLAITSKAELEAVDKAHQAEVGFTLFEQLVDDGGKSGSFNSYQTQLYDVEEKLKKLGVKDPWEKLAALRIARAKAVGS